MSSKATVSQLPSTLRDVIQSANPQDEDYGSTDKEKAEVADWILKVANGGVAKTDLKVTDTCRVSCLSEAEDRVGRNSMRN